MSHCSLDANHERVFLCVDTPRGSLIARTFDELVLHTGVCTFHNFEADLVKLREWHDAAVPGSMLVGGWNATWVFCTTLDLADDSLDDYTLDPRDMADALVMDAKLRDHRRALTTAADAVGRTVQQMLATWAHETPHFEGTAAHRYDEEDLCVYCGRPKDFEGDI